MKIKRADIDKNTTVRNVSEIKVEEHGRQAIFLNAERLAYRITKVDGGVIAHITACDWIVTKPELADLLIELKGTDVKHAVEQIQATAEIWDNSGVREGKIAGLVVCKRRPQPRFSTGIQRMRDEFVQKFKGPLHIVDKNQKFNFEAVLSLSSRL